MLTIVTIAVPIALVAIIAAVWWVTRDPTPPPPGRHRHKPRDPHDIPLVADNEEAPSQDD